MTIVFLFCIFAHFNQLCGYKTVLAAIVKRWLKGGNTYRHFFGIEHFRSLHIHLMNISSCSGKKNAKRLFSLIVQHDTVQISDDKHEEWAAGLLLTSFSTESAALGMNQVPKQEGEFGDLAKLIQRISPSTGTDCCSKSHLHWSSPLWQLKPKSEPAKRLTTPVSDSDL